MNNFMSFVVNTGTREGDQHEIARYQQYYLAHGVALAAQPQPQGGFLCTMYQPPATGGGAAQPQNAVQPQNAASPQNAVPPLPPLGAQAPAGYAAPQQQAAAMQAGYAAPAAQADASASAYGPPPQPLAAQPGYGAAPQQHQPYAAAPAAPATYGAPGQQLGDATRHGFGTPQQYGSPAPAGYAAPQQQYGSAPPPAYAGGAAPAAYGAAPAAYGAAPGAYGAAPAAYGAAPAAYGAAPAAYGEAPPAYGAAQPAFGDAALPAPAAAPQPYGGAPAAYGASPQEYGGAAPPAYGAPPQEYGAAPAAYGAGFSAGGGPGVAPAAWAPGAPAPAARRHGIGSAFSSLSLMSKLKFAGTGIFVLGLAGFSFFMMRQAQSNIVLFENSLDTAGELSLAGKSYGSISPRQALRLELDPGNYEVTFNGNGTKLDGGTLTVPKGSSGIGSVGYRAVYNIGGKKGIAVVTKYYGGSFEDRVAPIAEGTRVLEVPGAQNLDRIDDGFPDTITVPKHQSYGTVVRVCHVDEAKGTVGCPGW